CPTVIARMRDMLSAAQRPLAIVGGGGWDEKSMAAFADFAARAQLPVATGFRRQDAFPNAHPCYAGVLGTVPNAALFAAVRDADVILAAGTRLGEILTQGYTLITPPEPAQKLIHVFPDSSELNKVYKS